jgi:alkylated DNA nucleotide flippase Atl1
LLLDLALKPELGGCCYNMSRHVDEVLKKITKTMSVEWLQKVLADEHISVIADELSDERHLFLILGLREYEIEDILQMYPKKPSRARRVG